MKRVVLIGLDPATVDFSDPALPPGMTAEKIHAGVKLVLADFAARGWHAQNCFITPDKTAVPTVERCLAGHVYDCVVIGAGLRLPPSRLVLFEAVVNASIVPRHKRPSPSTPALKIAVRQPRAGSDTRVRDRTRHGPSALGYLPVEPSNDESHGV